MKEPPRFNSERIAMLLLAVLVVSPVIMMVIVTVRCIVWFLPECIDPNRLATFRDWLAETIPVLVAIIMRGGWPPSAPPPSRGN